MPILRDKHVANFVGGILTALISYVGGGMCLDKGIPGEAAGLFVAAVLLLAATVIESFRQIGRKNASRSSSTSQVAPLVRDEQVANIA